MALVTSWLICERPTFLSGLVVWLSRLGLSDPMPTPTCHTNGRYWVRDIYLERRMRIQDLGNLARWQNVELVAIRPTL